MRYLCVHCDKSFEHTDENKKPRCPECLRVNGLEKMAEPKAKKKAASAKAPAKPWLPWAIGAGLLAAGGVGYLIWSEQSSTTTTTDPAALAPLEREAVQSALEREHVDARQLGELLVVTDAVQSFADRAAGSASGAQAISQAILRHIRARAAAGAFDRWSIGVPRDTPLAVPAQVAEWLGDDDGHRHLYPLEIAALMTVALRAKGVPAMIAEVYQFRGDRAPADASGQIGYFAVAVYPGEPGEGDPRYYDPYGGREVQPEAERVLTDLQAIGQALNHRALHLLARESDAERAMDESSSAMRLDRRSPGVRAVRGAVLIAAAQPNEGLQELEAARQLRDDPPRRNLLAQIYFAQGDLDAASSQVSSALEDAPDFAAGRATLAAIQLARGESDLARGELEEARRADPDLHLLPMLWAEYYAVTGDTDRAVTEASEGIRRNPGDLRSRLMAARIYRQAARYDLMRREARAILERTPPARRPEMEQLVTRLLGPTALDPEEDALASAEEDEGLEDEGLEDEDPSEPGGLRLDSSLMGGGAQGPSVLGGGGRGPSLLGGEQLGGGGLGGGGGGSRGPSRRGGEQLGGGGLGGGGE